MDEFKNKIEAILFSVGKYIPIENIAKLCNEDVQKVKESLRELQVDYENNPGSLLVLNDGEMWKLTTREEYVQVVRKVVSETELSKTLLETLAVIAFKYPIKQSDLIKIRTNKAYDHLMELERDGFITRKKYGRSRLIKLTDKFFEYFDLPREKLKDRFKGFEQLADTIEGKEKEIEIVKDEQRKAAEEAKSEEKKVTDSEIEIDLVDDEGKKEKLEVFEEPGEIGKVEEIKEKLGKLDVVDEEPREESEEIAKETEDERCEGGDVEKEKDIDDILNIKKEDDSKIDDSEEKKKEETEEDVNTEEKEESEDLEKREEDEKEEGVDLLEAEQAEDETNFDKEEGKR